jgi:protein gp37
MGRYSKIEWCDHTFNPWVGCTKISLACDHCYAESWSKRSGFVEWGNRPPRRTTENNWTNPLRWNESARAFRKERGHRPRVFCASLADVFDNQAPSSWRTDLFELVRECRRLDWLLLTKRPQNISKMLPAEWGADGSFRKKLDSRTAASE